jgi:hypothetical protein
MGIPEASAGARCSGLEWAFRRPGLVYPNFITDYIPLSVLLYFPYFLVRLITEYLLTIVRDTDTVYLDG